MNTDSLTRSSACTWNQTGARRPGDNSVGTSCEPIEHFELRYLHALSDEGVDLHAFLDSWRRAMEDDLEHLAELRREGGVDRLRDLLHRLSGAVGLVGAHSLMEALRRASAAPLEHNASAIEGLMERARTLVAQLERAVNTN